MWIQKEFSLPPKKRGFHLITTEIVGALPELGKIQCGVLHLFNQAYLGIADDQRERRSDRAPGSGKPFQRDRAERAPYFLHDYEGDDDMPAHIKNCLLGSSLTIPVTHGRLNLGVWRAFTCASTGIMAAKGQSLQR